MKTSNQLNRTSHCANNSGTNLTSINPNIMRAGVINLISRRLLLGEPIEDLETEIDSMLHARRYKWENETQKTENIKKYADALRAHVEYQDGIDKIYLDSEQSDISDLTTVNVFGEDVLVTPEYIQEHEDYVVITKVSTGAPTRLFETEEDYAFGLLGEKLFPDKFVFIEHVGMNMNSDGRTTSVSAQFDNYTKGHYETAHEREANEAHVCSPSDCIGCGKFNQCNFKKPPEAMELAEIAHSMPSRLTFAQNQVVEFERGTARVNAGAGAGKTTVVAARVVSLLEKGYDPEDFVVLTFTKNGADEMTARIMAYAAEKGIALDPERFTSGTFNGFCQDILTEHLDELGFDRPPRVIPDEIRLKTIHNIVGNKVPRITGWSYASFYADIANKKRTNRWNTYVKTDALNVASQLFSLIKREHLTRENCLLNESFTRTACPGRYTRNIPSEDIDNIFLAYNMYEAELKSRNMIEFDDQLGLVNKLYDTHTELFEELGCKHLIVDEFQDTDYPQIELINKLRDTRVYKSFMAVGDDSQSIFGFRHTSPEYMINFENYFGDFTDFQLVENHRSTKGNVDFANTINEHANNKVDKDLIATKADETKPIVVGNNTKNEEFNYITRNVKERWEAGNHDICIMFRNNKELSEMADYLTNAGVPSIITGQIPITDNSRVMALLSFYDSYFRGTTQGFADYKNILADGTFKDMDVTVVEAVAEEFKQEIAEENRNMYKFKEFAEKLDENKIDACYQDFLDKFAYCENTEELHEFMEAFRTYGLDSTFKREGKFDAVTLSTIHNAKGSEWDTTFLSLTGFDKSNKHTYSYQYSPAYDEDIRMFFVGATRAKEKLIISGQYLTGVPSAKAPASANQYLKMAFDTVGKAWGYNYGAYIASVNAEKAQAEQTAIESTTKELAKLKPQTINEFLKNKDISKNIEEEKEK